MGKRSLIETKEIKGVTVRYYSDGKSEWVEASCPHCNFDRSIDIQRLDMGNHIAMQINGHIKEYHPTLAD